MSLDGIIRAIRDDTDRQIEQVEAEAAAELAAVSAQAAEDARRAEHEAVAARNPATDREVAKILDRARLDAHRTAMWAIETAYREALAEVRARLVAVRGTDRYPTVLSALLDEGLRVLGDAVVVRVDAADVAVARGLVADRSGDTVEVAGSLSCMGGLQLVADDGRRVDNTFESRLDRADGRLRALVGALHAGGPSP